MALPEDTPLVNTEGSSPSGIPSKKKILVPIIGVLVLALVFGAGVYYYYQSTKKPNIAMTSQQQEQSSVPAKLLPYQETQSMTEADYDAYLAQKITGFEEEGLLSANLGFAQLSLSNTHPMGPLNEFNLEMVPVPNLAAAQYYSTAAIQITGVYNAQGKIIANQSTDFQSIPAIEYTTHPTPHMYSTAGSHLIDANKNKDSTGKVIDEGRPSSDLIDSAKVTDITKITGILRLKLPVTTDGSDSVTKITKDFLFTLVRHTVQ